MKEADLVILFMERDSADDPQDVSWLFYYITICDNCCHHFSYISLLSHMVYMSSTKACRSLAYCKDASDLGVPKTTIYPKVTSACSPGCHSYKCCSDCSDCRTPTTASVPQHAKTHPHSPHLTSQISIPTNATPSPHPLPSSFFLSCSLFSELASLSNSFGGPLRC